MIEQQSNLISSLADAVQQSHGHRGDHLKPLLEGQQSVLDRLSILESGQAEVTDTLASLDERQSDEIVELRSQLDEAIAEKEHQVDRNHQLQVELLKLRQALTTAEDRQKESRAALEVISKRNSSLQFDIRKEQEDKQKLSFELESSEAARGHLASTVESTQADLETMKGELDAEKSRNVSLSATCRVQASELVGLREATSRLQVTLVDRLSRIEEGVQQSTIGSAEYSKLQERNQKLQEEVNELNEKVSKQSRSNGRQLMPQCHDTELSKQSEHLNLIHLRREFDIVRRELDAEGKLRRQAEERAIAAETSKQDTIFVSPQTSTKPLHIDSTSVADQVSGSYHRTVNG
jgi:chromosome segregation ATPase